MNLQTHEVIVVIVACKHMEIRICFQRGRDEPIMHTGPTIEQKRGKTSQGKGGGVG